jgi:hypothetical protein
MKQLVMSVHGIHTKGEWQTALEKVLGTEFRLAKFSYDFTALQIPLPFERERVIDEFAEWYRREMEQEREGSRPSVVAHSFGTYIVGWAMQKYREIRFDKILFCGGILPCDFDWGRLLGRNQVWLIRNEFGSRDYWAGITHRFVQGLGNSGAKGFDFHSPALQDEQFVYKHGDYPRNINLERWASFLKEKSLNFEILYGSQISDVAYYSMLLDKCHDLDQICFRDYGHPTEFLPRNLSLRWIEVNPAIYVFLLDVASKRLLGYANVMLLKPDAYERLLNFQIGNKDVESKDLLSRFHNGDAYLYFMSIAIEPDARRIQDGEYQSAFERLMYAVTKQYNEILLNRTLKVLEVGAVTWTPEGQRLCRLAGMGEPKKVANGRGAFRLGKNGSTARVGGVFRGLQTLFEA